MTRVCKPSNTVSIVDEALREELLGLDYPVTYKFGQISRLYRAASVGDLELCKKLVAKGESWSRGECTSAAQNGHQHILEYAFQMGAERDRWLLSSAAVGGYFDLVKWLYEQGCQITQNLHESAANSGYFEILQWAHNITPVLTNEYVLQYLAQWELEHVMWAHKEGYHWNKDACCCAARFGRLDNLKYLIDNGCPFEKRYKTGYAFINEYLEGKHPIAEIKTHL